MSQIDEELIVWGRTFKRVNGLRSGPAERGFAPNDDGFVEEIDVYSEANPEEDEVNAG